MSFYSREAEDGLTPAELVTFLRGTGVQARVWRYSTLDRAVVHGGLTYQASTITRDAIRREQTSGRASCKMTLASSTPFVVDWLAADAQMNRAITAVTVLRVHVDATGAVRDPSGEPRITVFQGNALSMQIEGATATIECVGLMQQLASQKIPRIPIARTCPWSVYDFRCGAVPDAILSTGTVSSVGSVSGGSLEALLGGAPTITLSMSGTAPLVSGAPDPERFNGGVLLWVDGGGVTRRIHITTTFSYVWATLALVLHSPLPAAAVGGTVTLWPGCTKTDDICTARFNNLSHFGGFPRLPERNPLIEGVL